MRFAAVSTFLTVALFSSNALVAESRSAVYDLELSSRGLALYEVLLEARALLDEHALGTRNNAGLCQKPPTETGLRYRQPTSMTWAECKAAKGTGWEISKDCHGLATAPNGSEKKSGKCYFSDPILLRGGKITSAHRAAFREANKGVFGRRATGSQW